MEHVRLSMHPPALLRISLLLTDRAVLQGNAGLRQTADNEGASTHERAYSER